MYSSEKKIHKNAEKKGCFTENQKAKYLFIKEDQHAGKVCKSLFSMEHGGQSDILQHKKN
jgi:hypothetical protein